MSLQCLSTINMVFSDEDKLLIKSLYLKGYTANRLTDKFPEISRTKRGVNKLLKKLWETGTVDGRKGVLCHFTWQSAERPRVRTPWHEEAQHCCWVLAALSPDVQQVTDGLSRRVKARLFSILFSWARRKGQWSLLPGCATRTADAASHASYWWWHVRVLQDSALAHRARDAVQLLQQETDSHCTRPVATRLEPGRLPCLGLMQEQVQDCSAWHRWPQAAPRWDLVIHSTGCHRRSHWWVGAATTSLRQSKGTSLRALNVTNRLFSETPNATI